MRPAARSRPRRRIVRRLALGVAFLALAGAATFLVQPLWLADVLAFAFPGILWRVRTAAPLVALSFDDGPAPDHTPQVLDCLARHQARATFFLIGDRAAAHPEMVRALRERGHEIGNHSYTVRSSLHLSDAEFRENLLRTEAVLGLGGPLKLYRPPGGVIRPAHLAFVRAQGYRCVLGSAYPFDPAHPPAGYIRWLVGKNLAPGTIVILHDGIADPSRMLQSLDAILEEGRRRGLRFVPVGELLKGARPLPAT